MSLRFIYGRAGSGKSHFCIKDIEKHINSGGNGSLVYLVPEQFSFQAEKNILNVIGEKSNLSVRVLSFKRMAFRVMNEAGGIARERMNSSGKCMLISYVLKEVTDDLTIFKGAAGQKGFVKTISDSISEFKRYAVTPELLINTADKIEDNINLKNKLSDIGRIYGEFESLLHENYIDSDDDLTLLSQKLDDTDMFKDAEIWIDEFSSFTPQQYKIIEKLMRKAKRISITLNIDGTDKSSSSIFRFTKAAEDRIIKIAADNNVKLDRPVTLYKRPFYRFSSSEELGFLEKNLYSFPYEKYAKRTKNIKLLRAQNTYTEIENTARDIIKLCRDNGYRYKDIAVITRELDSYENIISAVFNEYEIPYFIDKKKDIEGNLIVVFLMSALEIITKNWSYESVFRYLKTGLTNIETDDIDILENYILAAGIKGKRKWLDEEKWDYTPEALFRETKISEDQHQLLDKVNIIRQSITEPLMCLQSSTKGRKTAEEICRGVFEFLEAAGAPEKVENLIEQFKKSEKQVLANEYSQIWNVIMELLDQTAEVMGETKITLEEFVQILQIGFAEQKMGLIPPTNDQVLVGSVERLRSHAVCALYIVGVNDGVFPSVSNDEGILSDLERDILKSKDVELAKNTKDAAFEEQFLVYTTLAIPSKYLRISYPMADYEGKSLRPSTIISRLKSIFSDITEESDLLFNETDEDRIEQVAAKVPAFNQLVYVLRNRMDGNQDSLIWRDVYKWFSCFDEWRAKGQKIFSGTAYNNQASIVQKEKARKLYGDNMRINVSKLERYAECPFAYYVQYGLKAKDRKLFGLSYPDLGTFMHTVIDQFSEKVKYDELLWEELDEEWCKKAVSEIVDKNVNISNNYILSSSPRYEYLTGRLKRVLTKTALVITNHIRKSSFRPVGYEVSFGESGGYPPIVVELSNGEKVNLIGRIDRIDSLVKDGETYIRIIDYKSGSKLFKLSEVYYGLQVQLLLYLDAILMEEGSDMEKEPLPGAVLYFKIDDPIVKTSKELSDEDLQKEIMKKFKMKGLLIDDPEIIKEMDKEMDGNSLIIPARINKDGSLGKAEAASVHQFQLLREHVKNIVIKQCENMLNGNISISPCKNNDSVPCDFCLYSSICAFDTSLENNNYSYVEDKKDEEVWELLEKEHDEKEGEK